MPATVPVMSGGASFCTAFGDSRLADMQLIAVQQWVADFAASGYAPATIRQASARLAGDVTLTRDPGGTPDGTR